MTSAPNRESRQQQVGWLGTLLNTAGETINSLSELFARIELRAPVTLLTEAELARNKAEEARKQYEALKAKQAELHRRMEALKRQL